MKHLVLGPAAMGIYAMVGALKYTEEDLKQVKEISGASAGAILALFLALGFSIDEITEICFSVDVPKFVKLKVGSFFNKFGFVEMEPIKEALREICKADPTFEEIDKKIYISAYCLNTKETVYFSKDTHPTMKIIDAVCMSMAIPVIFASAKHDGFTYVDGGTAETYPIAPFLNKKPHEITCLKLKSEKRYTEKIENPREFLECLITASINNRMQDNVSGARVIEIQTDDVNIFDFNLSYEEKIKLYNIGYFFL
jgi:predicted acylesterase/phospholipase RssA